jgi:CubicO group peptidase (beta-lactamase class C family)
LIWTRRCRGMCRSSSCCGGFAGNRITVRSVLDMHSGIPGDNINGQITQGKPYPGFNRYLLRALATTYPERRVNTAFSYSNGGYVLLQNLVQNVTGQSFATYTREHLFVPIGMRHTTFDDAAVPSGALSHGDRAVVAAGGEIRVLASPREYINGCATGSVVSSATDMAAYLKTLIAGGVAPTAHRIIARRTLQEMVTPQTRLPLDVTSSRTGLGWTVGDTRQQLDGAGAALERQHRDVSHVLSVVAQARCGRVRLRQHPPRRQATTSACRRWA